ncbi:MAG: aldehyde dehydrogenase family protein [Flavobacteriales bacterium]|nr:aldehyde dehydrogenase family protein [Flavobacteriales bacterium]
MQEVLNYIGGTLAPARSGAWLDGFAPAEGRVFARIADSGPEDVELAVAAAEKAGPAWVALGRQGRHDALMRVAALVERDLDGFARAESRDNGKPVHLAMEVDIPRAIANLRFFATAILHQESAAHEPRSGRNPQACRRTIYGRSGQLLRKACRPIPPARTWCA